MMKKFRQGGKQRSGAPWPGTHRQSKQDPAIFHVQPAEYRHPLDHRAVTGGDFPARDGAAFVEWDC
jgi:hypothetical protein